MSIRSHFVGAETCSQKFRRWLREGAAFWIRSSDLVFSAKWQFTQNDVSPPPSFSVRLRTGQHLLDFDECFRLTSTNAPKLKRNSARHWKKWLELKTKLSLRQILSHLMSLSLIMTLTPHSGMSCQQSAPCLHGLLSMKRGWPASHSQEPLPSEWMFNLHPVTLKSQEMY